MGQYVLVSPDQKLLATASTDNTLVLWKIGAALAMAGDTARAATSAEVKRLRHESRDLKAIVAEQAVEIRLLKKSMLGDGDDDT